MNNFAIGFIGIRAHHLRIGDGGVDCIVQDVIGSPFDYSVVLRVLTQPGSVRNGTNPLLYWELSKSDTEDPPARRQHVNMVIPEDKLLFMR